MLLVLVAVAVVTVLGVRIVRKRMLLVAALGMYVLVTTLSSAVVLVGGALLVALLQANFSGLATPSWDVGLTYALPVGATAFTFIAIWLAIGGVSILVVVAAVNRLLTRRAAKQDAPVGGSVVATRRQVRG